jgi:hypothetical protein
MIICECGKLDGCPWSEIDCLDFVYEFTEEHDEIATFCEDAIFASC